MFVNVFNVIKMSFFTFYIQIVLTSAVACIQHVKQPEKVSENKYYRNNSVNRKSFLFYFGIHANSQISKNKYNCDKKRKQMLERTVHGIFLILGLVTVGCVLLITVYLIISGLPAIRKIGLVPFLFGKTWASTAAEPSFGILPFLLTSIYGTAGAILIGVPVGFLTAVYLAKIAPPAVKSVVQTAVSMLAGIPSVVYGLVGMLVLVPGIRKIFHVPDGASLLAAIVVLSIMILPSIIKVSVTALEAVPKEYEDASLALGATPV